VGRATLPWIALTLLASPPALAQKESVHLEYRAEPSCPSREVFIERVRARTSRAEFVEGVAGSRRFIVSASMENGRALGSVTTGEDEGGGGPRRVSGGSCSDVVSALALITALAIDPRASTSPASESPAPTETPPAPSAPPAPPVTETPLKQPEEAARAPQTTEAKSFLATGIRLDAGTGLGARAIATVGAAAFVEWGTPLARPWVAAIRLSGRYATSPTLHASQGGATFRWLTVALDACPLELPLSTRSAIRPCAGLDGGQLHAEGIAGGEITHSTSSDQTWLALHESVRAEIRIGGGFQLELEGGLEQPLLSYAFRFENPEVAIARVAPVGARLSGSAGFRF
jgi:hypothetical protein